MDFRERDFRKRRSLEGVRSAQLDRAFRRRRLFWKKRPPRVACVVGCWAMGRIPRRRIGKPSVLWRWRLRCGQGSRSDP